MNLISSLECGYYVSRGEVTISGKGRTHGIGNRAVFAAM